MKNLLLIVTLMGVVGVFSPCASATILVDFTRNDYGDLGGGAVWANLGHTNPELSGWNLFYTKGGSLNLLDSNGNATTVSITESTNGGHWTETGTATPPATIPVATALVGRFLPADTSITETFSGLESSQEYAVTAYVSSSAAPYEVTFQGGGLTLSRPDIRDADGAIGTFSAFSDAAGVLAIDIAPSGEGFSVLINALSLEVVPEPSTLGLLGLGATMIFRRRTR